MGNVPKQCWNLHHSSFIIFIPPGQGNWIRKGLSYRHVKSWNCLFNCIRNKKLFLIFWLHFLNLDEFLNILQKNMTLIDFLFPKLRPPKTYWDKCLKSLVSEDSLTINMVNVPKHCSNLHHSTFIRFFNHYQVNWVGKSLCFWHAKSWDCLLTHWLPMKSILFLIETI